MKKVLFSTVAMSALILMATSCADDQTSDLKAGAESTVTITAQLPGDMGTRAFADGTKATELHYAVYEKNTTSCSGPTLLATTFTRSTLKTRL